MLNGETQAVDYWNISEKRDTYQLLGISIDHLSLVDGLFDQCRKDIPNFLRSDLYQEGDSDETALALVQNAGKACVEYHLLAPFMETEALTMLRNQGILMREHAI